MKALRVECIVFAWMFVNSTNVFFNNPILIDYCFVYNCLDIFLVFNNAN